MTHGLYAMKRAFQARGNRAIDGRTAQGKAVRAWQAKLIAELGGPTALSAPELACLDPLIRTKFMLEVLGTWLLAQSSVVNPDRRALIPAAHALRGRLGNRLMRQLRALVRARANRPVVPFYEYLVAKYGADTNEGVGTDTGSSPRVRSGRPLSGRKSPATAKVKRPATKAKRNIDDCG